MAAVGSARIPDSPGSSPRLPSPPPMPEFQFGPQSPSISASTNELQVDTPSHPDETAQRRVRPGTKATDIAKGPPLVPLTQLDSAFQLQEHLKSLFAQYTHGQSSSHIVPITRDTALHIANPPQINDSETVDKNLWLYELCRFLTMKANLVSVALMADHPACSAATCPEMRASEWQYLCAVHEPPKSCCAIDYVNHTLDWAANVLTSTKHFPSRIQLGGETGNVFQSMRQLTNIFRRVYRIFAHAWFQHREVFWYIESTYGIYMLFKTVCDKYQLIPEDNYTVPPEAEGIREDAETPVNSSSPEMSAGVQIMRKDAQPSTQNGHDESGSDPTTTVSSGATTRRHKHTPSTGSHVGTIAEGSEDEDDNSADQSQTLPSQTQTMLPIHISPNRNKPSPERATLNSLGRLDISSMPAYALSNPEDPTPTTATSDKDPLSAARFATPTAYKDISQSDPQDEAHSRLQSETQPSTSETPVTPSTSEQEQRQEHPSNTTSGNVQVKVRRDSGLESEVRSRTGGSVRTAGTDTLSAILTHIEGYDEIGDGDASNDTQPGKTDVAASDSVAGPSPPPYDETKSAVENKESPETVVEKTEDGISEGQQQEQGQEQKEVETQPAAAAVPEPAEEAEVKTQDNQKTETNAVDEEDHDDEMMEEIVLRGNGNGKEE